MDEQQIRLLVRQALARHDGALPETSAIASAASVRSTVVADAPRHAPPAHPASAQFVILRAAGETECIIEPAVPCTHCGYCQCYGH